MESIKDMKTWAEAETWLSRHGYGPEQIRLLKDEWEASKKAPAKPEAAKPAAEKPAATKPAASK